MGGLLRNDVHHSGPPKRVEVGEATFGHVDSLRHAAPTPTEKDPPQRRIRERHDRLALKGRDC